MSHLLTASPLLRQHPVARARNALVAAAAIAGLATVAWLTHELAGGGSTGTANHGTSRSSSSAGPTAGGHHGRGQELARAPRNLTGVSENQRVFLSWDAPPAAGARAAGYTVVRDGSPIARVQGATTFTDTHVRNGRAYVYRVLAQADSASSNAVRVIPQIPVPLGVAGQWHLRFDDEFDGTRLDLAKWQPNWFGRSVTAASDGVNKKDLSCAEPSQLAEGGGLLTMTASAGRCAPAGGRAYSYAGSLINTYGKFMFTYGYLEARIFIPTNGQGTPVDSVAFWADGLNWPVTGELDVLEVLRACGFRVSWHWHSSVGGDGGCVTLPRVGGWHTFGADWEPGAVNYYCDGALVGRAVAGITGAPMYLIVSFTVNPYVGGPAAPLAHAYVKYVRVWQRH